MAFIQRQNVRKEKNGVYNVKIYVRQKNRRLQRQNLRKTKKIGVYNVKIYVRKKIGVYNVTDNVNQNGTRQPKHRGAIIEEGAWTKI